MGIRLLEFEQGHRSILHPRKRTRLVILYCPCRSIRNQVDFILLPRRLKSSIYLAKTRVYIYPGADNNVDLNLVLTRLIFKLMVKCHTPTRMKTTKPSVAELSYQARVGGKFFAFNFIVCDVDTVSDVIKEVILMFLGVQRQQKAKQKNSRPQRKFLALTTADGSLRVRSWGTRKQLLCTGRSTTRYGKTWRESGQPESKTDAVRAIRGWTWTTTL